MTHSQGPMGEHYMIAEEFCGEMFQCAYIISGTGSMDFHYGDAMKIIKERDQQIINATLEKAAEIADQDFRKNYGANEKWKSITGYKIRALKTGGGE